MTPEEIAPLVDHTNLRPDASDDDMRRLAEEAVRYGFCSACANTRHVALLAEVLSGTEVRVTSVAGFPLGAATPSAKAYEAGEAVRLGADEVDMVLSVGDLVVGAHDRVREEIELVRGATPGAVLKVILECGLLTDDQKRAGAFLAVEAGADFVKTSTGFGHGGATVTDVRLLREAVGPGVGVKASGGIRTFAQAAALIAAGANRLGSSSGPSILTTPVPGTE
ncbi:MAG: deoxyribose-phosphate aldolase [Planctomycetota bacterium]